MCARKAHVKPQNKASDKVNFKIKGHRYIF